MATRTERLPRRATAPRLVIEGIEPSVDDGRYPVKRVVGDALLVRATVYREGHDLLTGALQVRAPGTRTWRHTAMTYERDFDRCRAEVALDRVGTWTFRIAAWTDRFGSWQAELGKRVAAGQDVAGELETGAALIDAAARSTSGGTAAALRARATLLRAGGPPAVAAALATDALPLVRRHLPPDDRTLHPKTYRVVVDPPRAACAAWYELFPRSQAAEPGRHGTFDDAARRLPALAAMGFDVVYLPPIHPVGVTKRKGRNNALVATPDDPGSPWAIGSAAGGHAAIEPRLGTLADFRRFVQAARGLGLDVALDYALQCSPDHPWVREHPEWFFVRPDGSIRYAENPPKKYEDIYPLNFWCDDYPALWAACRDVMRYWIDQGVRTFRVDNPHTKPFAFWEWLIGEIKGAAPDVVLLAEAFTRPARMHGLAKLGFSQSYTYFTWRNTAHELREYLTELTQPPAVEYFRPNLFANTPDILHEYLQRGGRGAFRVRLLLAATLAPLYGIYSGFELCEAAPLREGSEEYLHSEKYELRHRDWAAPGNIVADVTLLNRLRREHPALQRLGNLRFAHSENDQLLAYLKSAPGDDLLVVVNLDPQHPQETMVHVPLAELQLHPDEAFTVEDLLTGARFGWRGARNFVRLDPQRQVAHVLRVVRAPTPPAGAAP
jgi:starch synthase (maltosyl-transferring)